MTNRIPEIGRSLIIVAADYDFDEYWISETHLCSPATELHSTISKTKYENDMVAIIPTIDDEINLRLDFAQGQMDDLTLKSDREFFRNVYLPMRGVNGPLSEISLTHLVTSGEFSTQLKNVRERTRCKSLSKHLDELQKLPRFYEEILPDEEP